MMPIEPKASAEVKRHRTAIARFDLSSPLKAVQRCGFMDGRYTVFDYGCGRGDDIAHMHRLGVSATGWDPYFAPRNEKRAADIVNLGFVLNVVENQDERSLILREAWGLASTLLVVSTIVGGRSVCGKYPAFGDGILTSIGTFQKYFTQAELREYIEKQTGRRPVAVSQGLFFVFRRDADERAFVNAVSP